MSQRPIFYVNKCKTHHLRTARHLTKANTKYKGENNTNNKPGSYMATRFHLTPRPPPSCYTIMSRNACLLFGTILLTPTFSSFSPGGRLEPVFRPLCDVFTRPLLKIQCTVTPYYLEGKKKAVWHVIERGGVVSYGAPDREHAEWRLQTPATTDSVAPGGVAKRAPLTPSRYLMTQVHARVYWVYIGLCCDNGWLFLSI